MKTTKNFQRMVAAMAFMATMNFAMAQGQQAELDDMIRPVSPGLAVDEVGHRSASPAQEITFRIVQVAQGTFGYEVARGGRTYIRQETVPGRAGVTGFATAEQAARVAELAAKKLINGIDPPTISQQELAGMGL